MWHWEVKGDLDALNLQHQKYVTHPFSFVDLDLRTTNRITSGTEMFSRAGRDWLLGFALPR